MFNEDLPDLSKVLPFTMRVCLTIYMIFCSIFGIFLLFSIFVPLITHQQISWDMVACCLIPEIFFICYFRSIKVEVTEEEIYYRIMGMVKSLRFTEISKAQIEKKDRTIVLVIYPLPEVKRPCIEMYIKPFGAEDLETFFEILKKKKCIC